MTPDGDDGRSLEGGWRIVLALALIGAALGFGWGIADQPQYRATATVAVESDSQGSDQARLERFAQRGMSEEVATRAAGLLGDDVPGADLLSDVTVRPAPHGGFVVVSATADAPDVAAAAADAFQRALVDVEGHPLALGEASAIPSGPIDDRPAALWAGIGLLVGLLAGVIVATILRQPRRRDSDPLPVGRRRDVAVPPGPEPADADQLAALADRLGAAVAGFDPGGAAVTGDGAGNVAIPAQAAADVGTLADLLEVRAGNGPRSLAVTSVGDAVDAAGLCTALAIAAAGPGRHVLVVEADLFEPSLAARLGVAPAPGLHDYLEDDASPPDVLRSVRTAGAESDGFACVPAGDAAVGARVAGPRFAALVDRLARVYDLVIYVAPPVLGSEDADAVTGLVDDVVVLVGADASSVELGHAGDLLAGAPVAIVATASR